MRATYFVSDLAGILAAVAIATLGSNLLTGVGWSAMNVVQLKLSGFFIVGLLAVAMIERTYAAVPPRPVRQFRGWVLGAAAVCGVEVAVVWLLGLETSAFLATLVVATVLGVVFASFNRAMCRALFGNAPWWGTRLIVVGSGGLAAEAFRNLEREPQWGLRPVGFVDDIVVPQGDGASSRFLGSLDRLDELANKLGVNWALAAVHSFNGEELADLLARAGGRIRHWIILPPLDRFPSLWLQECEAARLPALTVTNRLALPWSFPLKRAFDLAATICVALVSLPVVAIIALLVRVTSPGPALYGQQRIGRNGRRFTAWKFRTMVSDADAVLTRYLDEHPEMAAEWQAQHKLKRDPRITWIGRWLRPLSLDELPQIWNVLVGDMSLVGPRPIVAAEIDKYADRYEQYVQVLPGVTGLWQVSGRNNTTYEERVDLDVYYVENWSLWLDLYILACTVKVVVLGEGAY